MALRCSICLQKATAAAAVVPCGHAEFCEECLRRWLTERSAKCPLCGATATAFRRQSDGTEVSFAAPSLAAVATTAPADLSGLDHAFFLCEAQRLRSFAAGQSRIFAATNPARVRHCRDAIAQIDVLCAMLREERPGSFDPNELLSHLYALQFQCEHGDESSSATPRRYGADDAEDAPDDDDADEYGGSFEFGRHQRRAKPQRVSKAKKAQQQQRPRRERLPPRQRHQPPPQPLEDTTSTTGAD